MKRYYVIWNRGYKACSAIADDLTEAFQMCHGRGHTRKLGVYRKYEDRTELGPPADKPEGYRKAVKEFMAGDKSGIVIIRDGEYLLG